MNWVLKWTHESKKTKITQSRGQGIDVRPFQLHMSSPLVRRAKQYASTETPERDMLAIVLVETGRMRRTEKMDHLGQDLHVMVREDRCRTGIGMLGVCAVTTTNS